MNNTKFTICEANQIQRDYILERSAIKNKRARENAIVYVAIDENNSTIGRIIVIEQDVQSPLIGKCWYIADILVQSEYRRKGIATALFTEIKSQAEYLNIIYIYGHVRPSLEASMFWLNQGVTMYPFGTMKNDINKPLFYGNYEHIFSYCIHRKVLNGDRRHINIRAIVKDEIANLINKYAQDESTKASLLNKSEELFGFAAIGENNETQGVIFAFSHGMKAPLDSKYWVTSIYVDPNFRHQGIGRSLIWRLYQYAQENDVIQLTNFAKGDHIGFWYKLGFDIYFRGKNTKGVTLATAMIRVK